MHKVIGAVRLLVIVLALLAALYVVLTNYSFFFARTVKGEIIEIERVMQPTAVLGAASSAAQLFSFAIAVKEPSGEIVTSSSEDRQWAVARRGFCVEAKFYPYPPWDLEKADTYFNARLVKLIDCHGQGKQTQGSPAQPAPSESQIIPTPTPTAQP